MSRNPSMTDTNTTELHRCSVKDSFCRHLTPESFAALAVEHLCLLDLAFCTVLAGIWLAGVVAAFTHAAAVQTVAPVLLQVEHPVVDIQQANAAYQTCGHCCPFPYTEEEREGERMSFTTHNLTESSSRDCPHSNEWEDCVFS